MPIYDGAGNHINENIGAQGGWIIGAVDTINGINRMLVYQSGQAHYWELTSTWKYQSHTAFYTEGTAEYFDVESQFQLDINNDGTIGVPALTLQEVESAGTVALNKDSSGRLYADTMPIYDGAGNHINENIGAQGGWIIGAVDTINGINRMLVYQSGQAHYWELTSTWKYQSHTAFYTEGTAEYFDVESQFQLDINNDGTIGKPVTSELQLLPPVVLPGRMIADLPVGYETSGLTWHQGLEKIFSVSDEGLVSMMNRDGTELVHWNIGGDFEAITVADHTSNFVYIGVENPDSVYEFDVSSGEITRTFSLTDWMTGPSNLGLEALTFVPDATHPEGGVFYAGLQSTGEVFRFGLSIKSSSTLSSVTFINTLVIEGSHTDLADLSYDPSSDRILALYDSLDRIKVIEKDGELRTQWVAPGTEQEAILYVSGELFIGEDFGGSARGTITQFSPFTSIVT